MANRDAPSRTPGATQAARALRRNLSPPERIRWSKLRNRRLGGLRFRRQHPIGPYIADFCCTERALVVEIDGRAHEERRPHHRQRDHWMRQRGLHVVRVAAQDITKDLDAVLRLILREAQRAAKKEE